MRKSAMSIVWVFAAGALLPSVAYAHIGGCDAGGVLHGLTHPFSGLDHVCAMLAVGLWAAQTGGRSMWVVPFSFVSVMAIGGVLAMSGVSLPFVEQGVVLSVLLLGIFISAAIRLPLWLGAGLVGLFALWHGQAHGAEMPVLASGMRYGAGFLLATLSLHMTGVWFALALQTTLRDRVVRLAGAGIALSGLYLAIV